MSSQIFIAIISIILSLVTHTVNTLPFASSLASTGSSLTSSHRPLVGRELPASASPGEVIEATGQRIAISSLNVHDEPMRVTAALFEPVGTSRGVVVLAPGTRGIAPECAPTYGNTMLLGSSDGAVNLNYEAPLVDGLVDRNLTVVMIDYPHHSYLHRINQGRAVIDAARAVAEPGEPVAFVGYSQGGGAAAAAAELVADYAPELNVVGTVAGAPPADINAVAETANPWMLTTVGGYMLISMAEWDPEFRAGLQDIMTEDGLAYLADLKRRCAIDSMVHNTLTQTPTLDEMVHAETFAQALTSDERIVSTLEANNLGSIAPESPILLFTTTGDAVIDPAQVHHLAVDYQELGADVKFVQLDADVLWQDILIHGFPLVVHQGTITQWVSDLF